MTTVYEWSERTSKTKPPPSATQRLKRVFHIDIETCSECGGSVKVIACIEDPVVVKKILAHLNEKVAPAGLGVLPESRAPAQTSLFEETHQSNDWLQ